MDANNNLSAVTEGQINALLGSDTSSFEALIAQLMSPRNEDRGEAEQLFNLCRARHLDTFLLKLVFSLRSSSSPDVRSMAAVLLRKQLGSWSQLNIQTQALIKKEQLSLKSKIASVPTLWNFKESNVYSANLFNLFTVSTFKENKVHFS